MLRIGTNAGFMVNIDKWAARTSERNALEFIGHYSRGLLRERLKSLPPLKGAFRKLDSGDRSAYDTVSEYQAFNIEISSHCIESGTACVRQSN